MKQVFDPEIPVDIVNLGLVYDCSLTEGDEGTEVDVKMTLTAPGCGMGPVIAADAQARIMSHGYRISPPGAKGDPSQPSVQEMTVKSWINGPGTDGAPLKAGDTQIHGVAFGGMNAVAKVEVSLDGGKTWQLARMVGPDLGRFAWRQFVFAARLPAGQFTLASRATDTAGNVQPEQRMENAGGYNNTSWADHAVKVSVA